jgi:hypothetical protein
VTHQLNRQIRGKYRAVDSPRRIYLFLYPFDDDKGEVALSLSRLIRRGSLD